MIGWPGRVFLVSLLLLGVVFRSVALAEPQPPTVLTADGEATTDAGPPTPGAEFTVDVGELADKFAELAVEERAEQIADWAVYGTLLREGLSPEAIRDATFDRAPLRLPSLQEVVQFNYGPGRHVVVGDDVWLFYSAFDAARPATLGRLADAVRMAWGEQPSNFRVYRFRSDLADGAIDVAREDDIAGTAMFSAAFGYHEAVVGNVTELAAWLETVDDVTHVAASSGGKVKLGGRRFDTARTTGASLDDIAALYQAHAELAVNRKVVEDAQKNIEEQFNDLVAAYNERVQRFNRDNTANLDVSELRGKVAALRRIVGDGAGLGSDLLGSGEPWRDSLTSGRGLSSAAAMANKRSLDEIDRAIDSLKPSVEKAMKAVIEQVITRLAHEGKDVLDGPGFSLDPQWDVPALIESLEALKRSPTVIVQQAQKVVDAWKERPVDPAAKPMALSAAEDVIRVFGSDTGFVVPAHWQAKIDESIRGATGKTGIEAEKRALLPFYQLKDALAGVMGVEAKDEDQRRAASGALGTLVLVEFIESQTRAQCARYDGILDGTRVGMNLFYTDVLAKLWAGLDYHRSAPVEHVVGFRSMPIEGTRLEATYEAEERALPATRLWFGPLKDGYALTASEDLNFAPIATRVYSAGSNPLRPGEETTTSESSRRVMGWWDRHYQQVADHEPQYHLQNQIMKWSLITGWMMEHSGLTGLGQVEVERGHRFDRWYAAQTDLRFSADIRMLPSGALGSPTECMEVLRSYSYEWRGSFGGISGGVSLGARGFSKQSVRVDTGIGRQFRRPGMDHAGSSKTASKSLNGMSFERPPPVQGAARSVVKPPPTARFRAQGADLPIKTVSVEVSKDARGVGLVLDSDGGALGRFNGRVAGNKVRLEWSDGPVLSDSGKLAKMSQALAKEHGADRLALRDGFMPIDSTYIVTSKSGFEVLAVDGPTPRVLRMADPGSSGRHMRSAAGTDGAIIEARPITTAESDGMLAGKSWQRLTPMDEGTGKVPGRVGRVFADEGPANGRAVRIETSDPRVPVLEGMYEGRTLHIKRPVDVQQPFNDLVLRYGLDSKKLRDLDARAAAAAPDAVLSVRLEQPRGTSIARSLDRNDVKGALAELKQAAREGSLDDALKGFRTAATELQLDGLRSGRRSDIGRMLTRERATPDELLVMGLAEVHRGDAAGVATMKRAFAGDGPSRAGLADAADSLPPGSPLRTFVQARSRPGETLEHVTFVPSRNRVHTVAPLPPTHRILDASERRALLQDIAKGEIVDIYVKKSKHLEGMDFDSVPARTLSKVEASERYVWAEVAGKELGEVRVDRLRSGETEYVRRDMAMSANPTRVGAHATRRVIISDCDDLDGDGQIDEDERAACR